VAEDRDWVGIVAAERCPDCGLRASGPARRRLPHAVRAEGDAWAAFLVSAPAEALRTRPAPGSWSALECGAHVRDVLGVFGARAERALTEEHPALGWWDHEAAVVDDRYNDQGPADVAAALQAAASRLASVVEGLDDGGWARTATRREGEAFTVEGLVRFALHEAHHHLRDAARATAAARAQQ
jgi:hypothetical protein